MTRGRNSSNYVKKRQQVKSFAKRKVWHSAKKLVAARLRKAGGIVGKNLIRK